MALFKVKLLPDELVQVHVCKHHVYIYTRVHADSTLVLTREVNSTTIARSIIKSSKSALGIESYNVCVQVSDFVQPSGTVSLYREETPSTRADSSLLSSLSFWLNLNDGQSGASKPTTPSEIRARKIATKCVKVSSCLY